MPASPSSVLVTGGAGFIGCGLAAQLAEAADRWVVFDSLHPQVHSAPGRPAALHEAAELIVGDVTHPDEWDELLSQVKPDVVVHLAAETGTAQSLSESTRHGLVNVVGTTMMLDAFTRAGHRPSHIVLTSSRAVYGEGTWRAADGSTFQPGTRTHAQLEAKAWDFDGTHIPNSVMHTVAAPSNIYGATKLAQENILSAWASSKDIRLSILRLQNVYGPGQSLTNPYTGIVSLFSQLARAGKPIPLYEDGEITRDFVFIDDVVSALVACIETPPDHLSRTLDVGSGDRTTIRDLAEAVRDFHGSPESVVTGQFRDGDVRHAACEVDHTTEQLDWTPAWPLERGVAALQDWIAAEAPR